jgi:hypothetical protein
MAGFIAMAVTADTIFLKTEMDAFTGKKAKLVEKS